MAQIDDTLIETLLRSSEGPTLDFKRQQYALTSNDEKGEFIKDILAMANAWKTSDAYILIGVEDGRGARATILGGVVHYDDANLQQLVNSKTNRAIGFEYVPRVFEGKEIAVLRIAKDQHRPIWLTRAFGRLHAGQAYVRHGSSTDVADAQEIEAMIAAGRSAPYLQLRVRARGEGTATRVVSLRSVSLHEHRPLSEEERGLVRRMEHLSHSSGSGQSAAHVMATITPRYGPPRQKIAEYVLAMARLRPVIVEVANLGTGVARDVHVELRAKVALDVDLRAEPPERPRDLVYALSGPRRVVPGAVSIEKTSDASLVHLEMGKIQPGRTATSDPFWIGALHDQEITFEATISSDETRRLVEETVSIKITVEQADFGSLEEAIDEFRDSATKKEST